MRLAAQESIVPGDSVAKRLRNLEQCGYQAVELMYAMTMENPKETKAALADSPIEALSMCTSVDHDLCAPGADVSARVSKVQQTLEFASQFGVRSVVSVPVRGPLADGVSENSERAQYRDALAQAGEFAASLKMAIVIEPLNRYETHLINRVDQAVATAVDVNSPGVAVMADFFHMNIEEADIARTIERAGRWIRHIHLADSNRLNPGRGHTEFGPGLRALKSSGFDGVRALECRLGPGSPLTELSESAAFINSQLS